MNYEPNTIRWQPGDLVIHDADAKNRHMLMVVLGHDSRGDVQTIYLHQGECAEYRQTPRGLELRAKIWTNPGSVLHDPARFGIELPPARAPKNSAEGLDSDGESLDLDYEEAIFVRINGANVCMTRDQFEFYKQEQQRKRKEG